MHPLHMMSYCCAKGADEALRALAPGQHDLSALVFFFYFFFFVFFFFPYLQDNMALVHWWYYPDSYREWKPQSEIEGKPEPPMPTPQLWKVQVLICWCWRGFLAFPPPKS